MYAQRMIETGAWYRIRKIHMKISRLIDSFQSLHRRTIDQFKDHRFLDVDTSIDWISIEHDISSGDKMFFQ